MNKKTIGNTYGMKGLWLYLTVGDFFLLLVMKQLINLMIVSFYFVTM